jgi:hypothetical protein
MAMYYMKIHFSFWDHPKTEILKEDYLNAPVHENYDAICRALFKLWSYCKERQHDGRLIMSARRLAKTADWKADPDKLIKILTNEDTTFFNVVPGGYQIHNWYKNNPDLNPDRQKDVSDQNTIAFTNAGKKARGNLLGGIVKHTRACIECGTYHINQEFKECYQCQGDE